MPESSSENDHTPVEISADAPTADSRGRSDSWLSWLLVATLTAALTGISSFQSIRRYQELRSGWSWDVAYYNQWFWSLTQGDGTLTVRPIAAYAQEGPSIWKMNYLTPIRLALAPLYQLHPGPLTLLVIQNVMFWWVIPAAYTLVRSETRSEAVALSAAALVPLTAMFWPLVWNDFRELQLAGPFVLWAVQGVRSRSTGWAAAGIAGMLACRQEFAVMVATFAFLPPRDPETLSTTLRWRRTIFLVGLLWLMFGFFVYLRCMLGSGSADSFIDQFLGPRASFRETLGTSMETLLLGMGAWAGLACLAPRVGIFALPWVWGTCSERWAMRLLSTAEWHSVRYVMPMAAIVLATGLVGYAQLANWLRPRRGGRAMMVAAWICAGVFSGVGLRDVINRLAQVPVLVDREEAEQVWSWIRQVGDDDAVMVDYEFSAPLSSRRLIYGCEMDANLPRGFPELGPEFRWLFIRNTNRFYNPLLEKGFDVVHKGKYATIARRSLAVSARNSDFFRFCANTKSR
jgi:Predicted membrane protein (DUF2079)